MLTKDYVKSGMKVELRDDVILFDQHSKYEGKILTIKSIDKEGGPISVWVEIEEFKDLIQNKIPLYKLKLVDCLPRELFKL